MATPAEVREALRKLHAVSSADATLLEGYLGAQEEQILLHTSEDAFRAFVLAQAQQSGVTQAILQRIDSGILEPLAKAEQARAEAEKAAAASQAEKALTTKQVLTQPVVLAVIGLASTGLTGLLTILLHLAGAS